MQVLVTGAAGGVGGYVVKELSQHCDVIGFDRVLGTEEGIDWRVGDVTSCDEVTEAAKGCGAIVHLAAVPRYLPEENIETANLNIVGTATVFEAAVRAEVPRVVQASSLCATGYVFWATPRTPAYLPMDEEYNADEAPDDMYGLSKLVDEQLAASYEARYGIETASLRMCTVWLPDYEPITGLHEIFLTEESDDDPVLRELRWHYVDVRDVARAYSLAVQHSGALGICNAGGADTPGGDWRLWVESVYPDLAELRSAGAYIADPTLPLWSIDKLSEATGYAPQHSWREYPTFVEALEGYVERRNA